MGNIHLKTVVFALILISLVEQDPFNQKDMIADEDRIERKSGLIKDAWEAFI